MKKSILFLIVITTFLYSCHSYYGKRIYKKLDNFSDRNSQLKINGYYYFQDSTFYKYNYKRKIYNGAFYPNDSLKIVYYNFIVLYKNGTGYVNLTTNWDGLHHSVYDSPKLVEGTNSKDSAHAQFLNRYNLKKYRTLNNKIRKKTFPSALYKIKNDSIFINHFRPIVDGNYTLFELKGPILDCNTFEITNMKKYKTGLFKKEENYKTSKIFKFEELK